MAFRNSERKPLLTTEAVAKWLGIAPRTLCLWAECEEIPAFKLGKQWRFRENDIRAWLDTSASKTSGAAKRNPVNVVIAPFEGTQKAAATSAKAMSHK